MNKISRNTILICVLLLFSVANLCTMLYNNTELRKELDQVRSEADTIYTTVKIREEVEEDYLRKVAKEESLKTWARFREIWNNLDWKHDNGK